MKKIVILMFLSITTSSVCMQPNEAKEIKALMEIVKWCTKQIPSGYQAYPNSNAYYAQPNYADGLNKQTCIKAGKRIDELLKKAYPDDNK